MNEIIRREIDEICPVEKWEIGSASLEGLLPVELSQYRYGLSLVRKLDDGVIDGITEGPTRDYFNLYHGINRELDEKTADLVSFLTNRGFSAKGFPATIPDSLIDDTYRTTLRYKISHKMTAARAGLGWIGKTDLLVTHRFGPRVRLATILTTEPVFEPGEPVTRSRCGSCTVCVSACPAHAATGEAWSPETDRDRFYDAFACFNYCRRISKEKLGENISICGLCLAVCPRGRM